MTKFKQGSYVRHVLTGSVYEILTPPSIARLESNGERAYCYRRVHLHDTPKLSPVERDTIWVRSQDQMEDGRFERINISYAEIYGSEYPT